MKRDQIWNTRTNTNLGTNTLSRTGGLPDEFTNMINRERIYNRERVKRLPDDMEYDYRAQDSPP